MGITYDVVPCILGESPNAAVARVYGRDDINEHLADEGLPPVAVLQHPPRAFEDWRTLILTRVLALDDWFRVDDDNGAVILWSARWNWQFELLSDSVTLRAREGPLEPGGLLDEEVLDIFRDTPHVLVEPDLGEEGLGWSLLSELPRPIKL